ncbi:hypothetical protein PR048_025797 [Dryococelus australis]|uniref:PiggyBac transposable element-derived protein domain-containing protein n=1 Tax=Dryococelus australis TaxID=614101 RepID=A0ABQ9GJJ7_9NEOP|nr:hypothetical protein PR048_025797 [Dryococelus australis]
MKKKGRRTFKEKDTTLDGIDIRAVKWFDNRAVTLVSPFESAEPVGTVTRYDIKSHREIEIPCPRIVRTYNQCMEGVDLLDSLITFHRIKVRSKEILPTIFFFQFVDLVILTAWLLYREVCKGHRIDKKNMMDLIEFRADIAESLYRKGK